MFRALVAFTQTITCSQRWVARPAATSKHGYGEYIRNR